MKKYLTILLAIAMLASVFTGCVGDSSTSTGTGTEAADTATEAVSESASDDEIHTVTYAYMADPLYNLDPAQTVSNGVSVMNNIYETLLSYDLSTQTFQNVLAESYEVSDDSLSWTFHIRQGVKFHTGDELTAEDVKFSIDRIIELAQGDAYIWANVDEIKVLDTYDVEFDLTAPCALDSVVSCSKGAFIFSKAAYEADNAIFENGGDCGTGPYKVENITWGTEVVLSKFDEYWGGWNDNQFDYAITTFVGETSNRRLMLETGGADITNSLTQEDIAALEGDDSVNLQTEVSLKTQYINLNVNSDKLSDVRVRQALAYAMPYESVIETAIGKDRATQAFCAVPPGMLGHSETVSQYSYDLDKAKELLAEAGYADGMDMLITFNTGDEILRLTAELYQAELAKIGISLEIRAMSWSEQVALATSENPNDRQDMFMSYSFPSLVDAYAALKYFQSGQGSNYSGYSNSEFDTGLLEAYSMEGVDKAQAEQMYIDLQGILVADCPAIWIANINDVWVTSTTLQGFKTNGAYTYVCKFYDTYYAD